MNLLAASEERADRVAEMVKAIAHPMRLRIIATLAEGTQRVNSLAAYLGARPSAVSQQLRILRMSGLVSPLREGGEVYYALAEPRLRELLTCLEGCHR
ncbi:MAG: metalloregulator ArsR/SmtB family transcription factor [Deltaproteobacteria bacterium]|nr:metalloregulator ArsR/SmtB family transcription factor [Deltaproteobacteria bacterium]